MRNQPKKLNKTFQAPKNKATYKIVFVKGEKYLEVTIGNVAQYIKTTVEAIHINQGPC